MIKSLQISCRFKRRMNETIHDPHQQQKQDTELFKLLSICKWKNKYSNQQSYLQTCLKGYLRLYRKDKGKAGNWQRQNTNKNHPQKENAPPYKRKHCKHVGDPRFEQINVGLHPWELPWVKWETSPCTGRAGKEARKTRLVDGCFNKQGKLPRSLVLGCHRRDPLACLPET